MDAVGPAGKGPTPCARRTNRVYSNCRARRGGSGALNPQSAIAGSNARLRCRRCEDGGGLKALTAGSFAMDDREPGQVRKKAAVSGPVHVPEGRPVRAGGPSRARIAASKAGARLDHATFAKTKPRTVAAAVTDGACERRPDVRGFLFQLFGSRKEKVRNYRNLNQMGGDCGRKR